MNMLFKEPQELYCAHCDVAFFSGCPNRLLQFQHIFPFLCRSVGGELQRKSEKDPNLCLFSSSEVLNVLAQPKIKVVI